MKNLSHSLSTATSLAVLMIISLCSASAHAAAKLTLSGKATEVKYETDADIRISLIDWSVPEQQSAVASAWRQFREDDDLESFLGAVAAQDTQGYLFTAAATGYRIKYAWQEDTGDGQMMHFLVTPGLKTRNPYLWNTPNNDSPEFTLVQVRLDADSGVVKTSLDGGITINEAGKLVLERFDDLSLFATVEDSTPYYLK
jgi:hypothetical protein